MPGLQRVYGKAWDIITPRATEAASGLRNCKPGSNESDYSCNYKDGFSIFGGNRRSLR